MSQHNKYTTDEAARCLNLLREDCGVMVIANLNDGYFVTDDLKLWQDYLNGRSIEAKGTIGKVHRQIKMVSDANGQGLLFVPGQGAFKNTAFAEAI